MKKIEQQRCLYCNREVSRKPKVYCDNKCQRNYEYTQYIAAWKAGKEPGWSCKIPLISEYVRRYILEKFNFKCTCCGWHTLNAFTNKIPLQVHHKDGDAKNCKESNLDLLCPNCHSLTENFGRRGGGSRQTRYKQ